jgi:hypothetical protein
VLSFPRPELLNRPESLNRFFNRFRPRWPRSKRSILAPIFRDAPFVTRQIAMGILPPHIISCVPSLFHPFILAARSDLVIPMDSKGSWKSQRTSEIQGSFTDGFALLPVPLSCPDEVNGLIEQLSPSPVTFGRNRTARCLSSGVVNHNFRFELC